MLIYRSYALALLFSCVCLGNDLLTSMIDSYNNYYTRTTSNASITLNVKTPKSERNFAIHRETKGNGFVLAKILTPASDRGDGTLRVNTKQWDYSAQTRKMVPLSDSLMMTSYLGSDFIVNEIFGRYLLADLFDFQLLPPDNTEPNVRQIKCTVKSGVVYPWPLTLLAINEKTLVPVRIRNFDSGHKLIRSVYFKNVQMIEGKSTPMLVEVVPASKPGCTSRLIYNSIHFDSPYPDTYFTLTKLREPIN